MRIDDDHKYHGAALIQTAEDPHFTAINSLKIDGEVARNAFRINDDIGLYLKYATKPVSSYKEYRFTFTNEHLSILKSLKAVTGRVYLGLVCIQGREICCLSYEELLALIAKRREAKGSEEDQYVIPITLPSGKNFRAYVNPPGKKGRKLGEILVPRADFPRKLFAEPAAVLSSTGS